MFNLKGLILLVVFISTQASLLGSRECTFGPSYWCSSIRNAKQCRAVTHCIQSVWQNQVLAPDNDSICQICTDMVQQARDTLESNDTQEAIKQVFDGSCHLIPINEIAHECQTLADDFIPELIETLASQMNPQVVCATAGLCNSVHVDRLLRERGFLPTTTPAPVIPQSQDDGGCKDCTVFIRDFVAMVKEHSKQDVLTHLMMICGQLGSLSDGCNALVNMNINDIYQFLTQNLDPSEACSLIGMCNGVFGQVSMADLKQKNGDEVCDFCVVIAQHWRDTLVSNSTEREFIEVLQGICRHTGNFENECLGLVDNYALSLYNTLMNNFDPKEACEIVGVCANDLNTRPLWSILHTGNKAVPADESLTRPSLQLIGNDEANSYKVSQDQHQPMPSIKVKVAGMTGVLVNNTNTLTSDQACTMCEFTLHFIQIQLQDKHNKEDIENAVKTVCSRLPKHLAEQCDDYVDAYGDQVIALLQQEIDPSVLCPEMGLCPKDKNVPSSENSPAQARTEVTCVACEFIMKRVKDMLLDRKDEEAVKKALDQVCSLLPHKLSAQCQTFVDENAIEVIQLIAVGVDPEQVCRMLDLCHDNLVHMTPLNESNQLPMARLFVPSINNQVDNAPQSSLENSGQSKVCVLCEVVMITLEKLVLDNSTHIEAELQKGMDIVCLHLPSTLQEDCLGFVDQYARSIIEMLVDEVNPQTVCRAVHLCTPPSLSALTVAAEEPVADERSCLICKALCSISTDSNSQDSLKVDTKTQLCDELTGHEKLLCESLTSHVFDMWLSSSSQCSTLGYCEPPQHLLGSEKCTWGPSFWCQSTLHAHSCGALSHCKERVWMGAAPPS